jgi:hypothetical protein
MLWMALIVGVMLCSGCVSQPKNDTAAVEHLQTWPQPTEPRPPSGSFDDRLRPRKQGNPDSRDYGEANARSPASQQGQPGNTPRAGLSPTTLG